MMTERQQGKKKKKKSLSCILEDSRVNDPSFVFVHSVPPPLDELGLQLVVLL